MVYRISNILSELGIAQENIPEIFCDNSSAIQFLNGSSKNKQSKHIQLKMWYIRDAIQKNLIKITQHQNGTSLPADALTKIINKEKFHEHIHSILGHNL